MELRQSQGLSDPLRIPNMEIFFFSKCPAAAAGEAGNCEEGGPCDSAGGYAAKVNLQLNLQNSLGF